MAKRGPKPTVTPEIKSEIIRALHVGMSLAGALSACGITRAAFRRARENDPKFGQGVKAAADKGKLHHLERIHLGDERWQSSAWFLERRHGAEYGQRVKVDHGGKVEVVEEVVSHVPAPHTTNGQGAAASGASRLPPE